MDTEGVQGFGAFGEARPATAPIPIRRGQPTIEDFATAHGPKILGLIGVFALAVIALWPRGKAEDIKTKKEEPKPKESVVVSGAPVHVHNHYHNEKPEKEAKAIKKKPKEEKPEPTEEDDDSPPPDDKGKEDKKE